MLVWFKIIISMFTKIFLIFQYLKTFMSFYDIDSQENNFSLIIK